MAVKPDIDVIICGAGIAGAAVAALLAQAGISCLMIERRGIHPVTDRVDPRALAITRASENILRATGAWPLIPADRIGHFRSMRVWDEQGDGDIEFDSADVCEPTLGYIIEQTQIELALQQANAGYSQIKYLQPASLHDIEIARDVVTAVLEDGSRHTARLIIGADGARSRLRTLAGIGYPVHDYLQQAVACRVTTGKPHAETARQRFLATGPLAFLPLADPHQCGIVWSTTPDQVEQLMHMDESEFNQVLARAFDHTPGEILSSGPRARFPLQHAQAEKYCLPRLALIGDAAHMVHPLAGQGANLGLLDAAALAEIVIDTAGKNRDIGTLPVLRRYERWRKGENYLMLKVLQGFKVLFENRLEPVKHLRNIGLDITDMLMPVKHCIMRHAMGQAGDLPSFARNH